MGEHLQLPSLAAAALSLGRSYVCLSPKSMQVPEQICRTYDYLGDDCNALFNGWWQRTRTDSGSAPAFYNANVTARLSVHTHPL